MSTTESGPSLRPSRRTVVKGAAWAVPVVAVAASTRNAAASVNCTGSFCLTSDFCKLPGESTGCSKGYRASASIQAQTYERILVVSVTAQGISVADNANLTLEIIPKDGQTVTCSAACTCEVTVPSGYQKLCIPASTSPLNYDVQVCGFGNSQSTTITLNYSLYRCADVEGSCSLLETAETTGGSHPCN